MLIHLIGCSPIHLHWCRLISNSFHWGIHCLILSSLPRWSLKWWERPFCCGQIQIRLWIGIVSCQVNWSLMDHAGMLDCVGCSPPSCLAFLKFMIDQILYIGFMLLWVFLVKFHLITIREGVQVSQDLALVRFQFHLINIDISNGLWVSKPICEPLFNLPLACNWWCHVSPLPWFEILFSCLLPCWCSFPMETLPTWRGWLIVNSSGKTTFFSWSLLAEEPLLSLWNSWWTFWCCLASECVLVMHGLTFNYIPFISILWHWVTAWELRCLLLKYTCDLWIQSCVEFNKMSNWLILILRCHEVESIYKFFKSKRTLFKWSIWLSIQPASKCHIWFRWIIIGSNMRGCFLPYFRVFSDYHF